MTRMDDDPEIARWFDYVRQDLVPMVAESSVTMALAPPTAADIDPQQAMEIGLMVLMDKPIVLVVTDDREVSPKLRLIADEVIEGALDDPAVKARVARVINGLQGRVESSP